MSPPDIEPDATIADVVRKLNKPEDYVRGVLGVMVAERHQHGAVVVRIGIRGTGAMPNYRIDLAAEPSPPIQAYDGQTHRGFTDVRNIDTDNWSSRSMTFEEVRGLIGAIRGHKA